MSSLTVKKEVVEGKKNLEISLETLKSAAKIGDLRSQDQVNRQVVKRRNFTHPHLPKPQCRRCGVPNPMVQNDSSNPKKTLSPMINSH